MEDKKEYSKLPMRIRLNLCIGGFTQSRERLKKIEGIFFISAVIFAIIWLMGFVIVFPTISLFGSMIGVANAFGFCSAIFIFFAYCASYSLRIADEYNVWSVM